MIMARLLIATATNNSLDGALKGAARILPIQQKTQRYQGVLKHRDKIDKKKIKSS